MVVVLIDDILLKQPPNPKLILLFLSSLKIVEEDEERERERVLVLLMFELRMVFLKFETPVWSCWGSKKVFYF